MVDTVNLSGNMVADNSQAMSVSWSPYGKILSTSKAGGANLQFSYNAMQQRVVKRVAQSGDTTRTYYIRDAQGNTMGVYSRHNDSVSWREQYIFGSSRLGLYRADTVVNKGLQVISKLYEGKRNYELTNHLGNVLAVINDRKTDSLNGAIKLGFNAVVISATDYYPFGMPIDSRSYTSSLYRYGFNGKENDKETGEQDYGMRMYDSKVPHFLSIDPISREYPDYSPYMFAGNNPIKNIDLDGLEPMGNMADFKRSTTTPVTEQVAVSKDFFRWIIEGFMMPFNAVGNDHAAGNARMIAHQKEQRGDIEGAKRSYATAQKLSSEAKSQYKDAAIGFAVGYGIGKVLKIMPIRNLAMESATMSESGILRVTENMGLPEKMAIRQELAKQFFRNSKVNEGKDNLKNLLNSIDYTQPVETITLDKGMVLYRWELDGKQANPQFFTDKGGTLSPLDVGFGTEKGYTLKTFEVTKPTKVLKSTIESGNATQYFSTELSNNTKPK